MSCRTDPQYWCLGGEAEAVCADAGDTLSAEEQLDDFGCTENLRSDMEQKVGTQPLCDNMSDGFHH